MRTYDSEVKYNKTPTLYNTNNKEKQQQQKQNKVSKWQKLLFFTYSMMSMKSVFFKNKPLFAFQKVNIRIKNTFSVKVCDLWATFKNLSCK